MKRLSVIIPAQNEAVSIRQVITEAKKLHPMEIIVVLNGSTDGTREQISGLDCRILDYPHPLGNDIGRAIGAAYARGDIFLFLDGDIPVSFDQLLAFVEIIESGYHVALNDLQWSAQLPIRPHITTVAKLAHNWITRQMLSVNSLLAIPHALSRTAVAAIGWWNLADPVLAQTLLTEKGFIITAPVSVDVINHNRIRPVHSSLAANSPFPVTTDRIIGDHLAALSHLIGTKGPRGGFTDGLRNRKLLQGYRAPNSGRRVRAKRSAVIPVMEERATIGQVIQAVRLAGVDEIIVVANGADPETIRTAVLEGVIVLPFDQPLGHNVGRAIGAAYSTGEICLFVDGDFALQPDQLIPFLRAVEQGVDVALNDLQCLLDWHHPLDAVSTVKYFLNLALKRPDLLNNSMTAVPHAIHRRVLDAIGYSSLMIPPLAQAKAVLAGYRVEAVHEVDVVQPNRARPDHQTSSGPHSAYNRITGDHLEALHYLFQVTDHRGGFTDGRRDRQLLQNVRREKA